MKRSPLARNTPLKPRSFEKFCAWKKKGKALPRGKAVAKVGRRKKREAEAVRAFGHAVGARALGYCEGCGKFVGRIAIENHHIVSRARGVGWPDLHNPDLNGRGACFYCHRDYDIAPATCPGYEAARAAFDEWKRSTRSERREVEG